jgi:hypothetical protein
VGTHDDRLTIQPPHPRFSGTGLAGTSIERLERASRCSSASASRA